MPKPLSLQSNTTHEITQQISRKLLRMDVLTLETCSALNNEIIKQVTSRWSIFIQYMTIFIVFILFLPRSVFSSVCKLFKQKLIIKSKYGSDMYPRSTGLKEWMLRDYKWVLKLQIQ